MYKSPILRCSLHHGILKYLTEHETPVCCSVCDGLSSRHKNWNSVLKRHQPHKKRKANPFFYSGSPQASSQALHFWNKLNRLRIPNGTRQTSWLYTSAAEELSQKLPGTNPASGQSGTWSRDLQNSSPAPSPLSHVASIKSKSLRLDVARFSTDAHCYKQGRRVIDDFSRSKNRTFCGAYLTTNEVFSLLRNCGAASMKMCNNEKWYQTSSWGSSLHRKKIRSAGTCQPKWRCACGRRS